MRKLLLITLLLVGAPALSYERVFYCVYATNECVSEKEAIAVAPKTMNRLLEQVLSAGENFIGFIDDAGTALQFYVDKPGTVWVEIPDSERMGSFGRYMSNSEVSQLIVELNEPYIVYIETLSLEFTPW